MCGDKCMGGGIGLVVQEETKACLMVQQCEWACLCQCVDIERRAVVGKATPEVLIPCVCLCVCICVCVCVCVCVTLASLPELKELAPDSEHTDTTHYCAGIECYVKKLSWEDWRWEINELQLKERNKKENGIFFEKEMRKPEGKNVQMRCRWANRLNLKG